MLAGGTAVGEEDALTLARARADFAWTGLRRVRAGVDLAAFRTAGAYGATMASTYNSRALVPEVLVDGDRFAVVADRVSPEQMIAAERVPEWL